MPPTDGGRYPPTGPGAGPQQIMNVHSTPSDQSVIHPPPSRPNIQNIQKPYMYIPIECNTFSCNFFTYLQNTLYVVNHTPSGPTRCNRCKAYMNPFCRFVDGGRQYVCPICQCSNEGRQKRNVHVHVFLMYNSVCSTCTCTCIFNVQFCM